MTSPDTTDPKRIRISNLRKSYQNGKLQTEVLKGLELDIPSSSVITLMGPSGSGKSTFLNILSGIDKPDFGEVFVNGKSLHLMNEKELTKYRREETGIVFQFFHLLSYLNALENVAVPLYISGISKTQARNAAEEALEKVGLSSRKFHKPDELSGGEQQRVAIARALCKRPSLILADEPTGNLDTKNAENVIQLLIDLQKQHGFTLFIVTHDQKLGSLGEFRLKMTDGTLED
ncbi:ABC transporter ATP-binding protein [Leptospira borgpetersenii]|uniref:ABC transporter, ATP-binding protein n=1 Tax=Leptospira borgpetersenii serovar Ballum TaxID=280505 RepID=A0A0E3B439_LEPBO|nr:ABC transporter ATP-binding protein [Leptospira borgpetersenii]EMO09827.1 ABC transporter, ATP-binding protein [Leptospira borgpetersenii str. Noumea 25]ALO24915.1 ABC transporter, ATP-binding protein [Leptospira borgpetersenii serovar Ballum]ANG99961.1 ABC transporter, ATP-binding protein [Leptospira borgpetersenii str. 4E]EKR02116.1 ABC transporter, ATP-binding protein [Leptospira borgpetersenii serovar Castellonis str. 200801910]KGE24940.1 ABC transporter [Leptospira borgpetersenii serov